MNAERLWSSKTLGIWFLTIAFCILAIIAVGGITRLTGSGLSMVEWRPILGFFPPMTEEQWQVVFQSYQAFPEYQYVNYGMSLEDFKKIFFWEYLHRVLGRIIGLLILVPLLIGWLKKAISTQLLKKITVMAILVIAQGILGWYMVKSGLVDRPSVSHFRLTAHLLLALVLLQYVVWTGLDLYRNKVKKNTLANPVAVWTGILGLQIAYGAFTAGLKAGWGYNSYPKMNGDWLPEAAWMIKPAISNLINNPVMVQFIHRHLGVGLLLLFLWLFAVSVRSQSISFVTRRLFIAVLVLLLAQVILGIATLVLVMPLSLAVLHQMLGTLLLTTTICLNHSLRRV